MHQPVHPDRLVVGDHDIDSGRESWTGLFHNPVHFVRYADQVFSRALSDRQRDDFFAVEPRVGFPVFERVVYTSHVAHIDRLTVPEFDDDILDRTHVLVFTRDPDRVRHPFVVNQSAGDGDVLGADSVHHVLEGNLVPVQKIDIAVDLHLGFQPPLEVSAQDTRNGLEFILKVFCECPKSR